MVTSSADDRQLGVGTGKGIRNRKAIFAETVPDRLCRKLQELYELSGPMVRTRGREYDQQITERHSLDRAERGSSQAFGLRPS